MPPRSCGQISNAANPLPHNRPHQILRYKPTHLGTRSFPRGLTTMLYHIHLANPVLTHTPFTVPNFGMWMMNTLPQRRYTHNILHHFTIGFAKCCCLKILCKCVYIYICVYRSSYFTEVATNSGEIQLLWACWAF